MPDTRIDCHIRLKRVKRDHETAVRTVTVFISIAQSRPSVLYENHLQLPDVRTFAEELHSFYFIRMFACFESSVRGCWTIIRGKITRPTSEVLLDAMAKRRGVPQDVLDQVQAIRDFRNRLVHEDHQAKQEFTIDEAICPLNKYISRLPDNW